MIAFQRKATMTLQKYEALGEEYKKLKQTYYQLVIMDCELKLKALERGE